MQRPEAWRSKALEKHELLIRRLWLYCAKPLLTVAFMTSKEKYIIETYGDLWGTLNETAKKCALKNDGWISSILEHRPENINTDYSMDKKAWRIVELTNFEDNNGWFKTEDDIFPEDEIPVLWLNFDNGEYDLASLLHVDFKHTDYTHWTPINLKNPVW